MTAWSSLLIWALAFDWWAYPLAAPYVIALQCWLYVGMFIVAHDAMHGTLWPGNRRMNTAIGTLCLCLYAGFRFSDLAADHHAHHAKSGSPQDPDFCPEAPDSFLRWYVKFFGHYFGLQQVLVLFSVTLLLLALGVRIETLLLFWAVPAILSSIQLFYFGTFRPHRHEDEAFPDAHNARDLDQPWLISLLTCFHFGHHHAHHAHPWVPWWRLPSVAKETQDARS